MLFHRKNKLDELSDEELFLDFVNQKNMEAIGVLFKRYTHLVLGVCMKYFQNEEAARDGVMQIFENLMKKPPKMEILNFKNWLFIVSKNYCLMQLRIEKSENRAREQKLADLQDEIMEIPNQMHLISDADEEAKFRRLHESMKKLGIEQQKCIELFYFEDKSYIEIVNHTGYDLKKVKSYIQNGKRNLKIMLDHDNNH